MSHLAPPEAQHKHLTEFWTEHGDRFLSWWKRLTAQQRTKILDNVGVVAGGDSETAADQSKSKSKDNEGEINFNTTTSLVAPELDKSVLCELEESNVVGSDRLIGLFKERVVSLSDQIASDLAFARVLHDTGLLRESDPTAFASVRDGHVFNISTVKDGDTKNEDGEGEDEEKKGEDEDEDHDLAAAIEKIRVLMDIGQVVPASVFEAACIRRNLTWSFLLRMAAEFSRLEGLGLALTVCASCGKVSDPPKVVLKVCARCRSVAYCSVAHQKMHWRTTHKMLCMPVESKE